MKRYISFFALLVFASVFFLFAFADDLDGTMVRTSNADPYLFFHDGKYYLTQTGTSRIAVFEADTVEELDKYELTDNISYISYLDGTVYDKTVFELFGEGATINGTWSPEIHYFSEEQFPGQSGFYMFLGLRKKMEDSSMVRMVVLKSLTDSPKGPYGHPISHDIYQSQPVLDADGNIYNEWACGQTVLEIPEGKYKGTYTMWVAEEGRGSSGKGGQFFQKIMIGKMKSPWQLSSEVGIVTTPTQSWEYTGASAKLPRVVEGANAVYGKNGEVFIVYSGSGYWSTYGLGQLTWTGGDPLEASSWVKLPVPSNPIFSATASEDLRGAGHASFLTDTDGHGFFCYHAYPYENNKKASARNSYIEPYYIDYTAWNGFSFGVLRLGLDGTGISANTKSAVVFETDGEYLEPPSVNVMCGSDITLELDGGAAEGYIIYRSEDKSTFAYLTTTVNSRYVDKSVNDGGLYHYRVYSYRNEEISTASKTIACRAVSSAVGDVSGDGILTLYDVLISLKSVAMADRAEFIANADMNGNGELDASDILTMLDLLAGDIEGILK